VVDEAGIQLRYQVLDPVLEERSRHRFAAAEAKAAGRGGVNTVARITGMARSTIIRGLAELAVAFGDEATAKFAPSRLRAFAPSRLRAFAPSRLRVSGVRAAAARNWRGPTRRRQASPPPR
jgi:hypothetical protein